MEHSNSLPRFASADSSTLAEAYTAPGAISPVLRWFHTGVGRIFDTDSAVSDDRWDCIEGGSEARSFDACAVFESEDGVVVHAHDVPAEGLDALADVEGYAKVRAHVCVSAELIPEADKHETYTLLAVTTREQARFTVCNRIGAAEFDHAGAAAGSGASTKSRSRVKNGASQPRSRISAGSSCRTKSPTSDGLTPKTASPFRYGSPFT